MQFEIHAVQSCCPAIGFEMPCILIRLVIGKLRTSSYRDLEEVAAAFAEAVNVSTHSERRHDAMTLAASPAMQAGNGREIIIQRNDQPIGARGRPGL